MTNLRVFLATLLALMVVHGEISEECRQETEPLLTDQSLTIAQSVVFEDYTASFNDKCDTGFGVENGIECSIEFEGDERTYNALCEGMGGQVYKRPIQLSCLLGAFEQDLGFVPTCVGASCNTTNIKPSDIQSDAVDAFLNNLTGFGCAAEDPSGSFGVSSVLWGFGAIVSMWLSY